MANAESRLRALGQFKSSGRVFLTDGNSDQGRGYGGIADDHLPFMARGVEILHMIPSPFPRVWHEMDDDGEHLDLNTVEDWAQLVTAFAAEWMELEGFMPQAAGGKRDSPVEHEANEKGRRKVQISKTEL